MRIAWAGWEAYFRRIELIDEHGAVAQGGRAWHKLQETEGDRNASLAFDGDVSDSTTSESEN